MRGWRVVIVAAGLVVGVLGSSCGSDDPQQRWEAVDLARGVTPACCDAPAVAPPSPRDPIPAQAWPADGYYDLSVVEVVDADTLRVEVRRWVTCADLPGACSPGSPLDGAVADPSSTVTRELVLDAELAVVIWPIPGPAMEEHPIEGSGPALADLLADLDAVLGRWVRDPLSAGSPPESIRRDLLARGQDDPAFPFGPAPHIAGPALRGPLGTSLTGLDTALGEWPATPPLHGWWPTLEVRDGRPVLHLYAGLVAG